jgi:hypothetical protein
VSDTQEPNQPIDQEREQLRRDVLEELRRESLKKEIVKELSPPTRSGMVASFLRHPVFLLFLGLLMTGVVGAGLTSYWQNKQWDYQQKRLGQIRDVEQKTKQKNDIKDQIRKDVEAILTADTNVLQPAFRLLLSERSKSESQSADNKALVEELKLWEEAEKKWRADSNLLAQTVAIDLKNQSIHGAFEQLVDNQFEVSGAIEKLKDMVDVRSVRAPPEFGFGPRYYLLRSHINEIVTGIEKTRKQLSTLLSLLVDQIEKQAATAVSKFRLVRPEDPHTFTSRLMVGNLALMLETPWSVIGRPPFPLGVRS